MLFKKEKAKVHTGDIYIYIYHTMQEIVIPAIQKVQMYTERGTGTMKK